MFLFKNVLLLIILLLSLILKVYSGNNRTITTQTATVGPTGNYDRSDPLRLPGPIRPHPGYDNPFTN